MALPGGDMHTFVSRRRTPFWLAAAVVLVAGCGASAAPSPAPAEPTAATQIPTIEPRPTAPSQPAASPAATSSTATAHAVRVTARAFGAEPDVGFAVDVPDGWVMNDGFVVKAGPVIGMSVWDVKLVPADPCRWQGSLKEPGPKVDDLVAALRAQHGRAATTPTGTTLAGKPATYLEWTVPADTGAVSAMSGCDGAEYLSWKDQDDEDRYQQAPGQVDRLWVLAVGDRRILVDATYVPETSQADRGALDRIVQSLEFEAGAG